MKKFLIAVILIVIFVGIIYFLGLVCLAVPKGQWGVVQTKTKGVDELVVEGGKWSWQWRWEKVLPTVMTIHRFKLDTFRTDLDTPVKGDILPSAKEYMKALNSEIDFSFEFFFYIEFSIIPQNLPALVKKGVKPASLNQYYLDMSGRLSQRIGNLILTTPDIVFEKELSKSIADRLSDEPDFSGIRIENIIPRKMKLPDYELYKLAKENYLKINELKLKAQYEKIELESQRDLLAIQKEMDIIKNIEKYGEILNKYPVLMDFLYMRNIAEEDYLKLSEFRIQSRDKAKGE